MAAVCAAGPLPMMTTFSTMSGPTIRAGIASASAYDGRMLVGRGLGTSAMRGRLAGLVAGAAVAALACGGGASRRGAPDGPASPTPAGAGAAAVDEAAAPRSLAAVASASLDEVL